MFALGILIIFGILQSSLIRPYYRDSKVGTIEAIADEIQSQIIENQSGSSAAVKSAFQLAVNNNVCVVIFNEAGEVVYEADGLGASCIFYRSVSIKEQKIFPVRDGEKMKTLLNESGGGTVSEVLLNDQSNQEMILYGRKVVSNLGDFYLYTNSPLEPIDSIITFLNNQYILYALIILFLSLLISLFISRGLANPIVKMKISADKLASSDYEHAQFEGSYFNEIDELAKTLNDARNQLSKVDELRKDLIANMSHDIKTPLTMIKAYAEMIRDISGENPEKREEHVEVIIKEVDYLDHLVADMQELSKMQSGYYLLNQENFDIVAKINDILWLFKGVLDETHIEVMVIAEESLIAYGDSTKLGQVLYNFISNAIKHSEENKKIEIKVKKDKEGVLRFAITDEAGGIPSQQLPYIWDRYYKIDKTFKRSTMGTGLGLAIVKAVLDNHGAKYGVTSEEGVGSTFWFELPKADLFNENTENSLT